MLQAATEWVRDDRVAEQVFGVGPKQPFDLTTEDLISGKMKLLVVFAINRR